MSAPAAQPATLAPCVAAHLCAVYKLVDDEEVAGHNVLLQRADGRDAHDPLHAQQLPRAR